MNVRNFKQYKLQTTFSNHSAIKTEMNNKII